MPAPERHSWHFILTSLLVLFVTVCLLVFTGGGQTIPGIGTSIASGDLAPRDARPAAEAIGPLAWVGTPVPFPTPTQMPSSTPERETVPAGSEALRIAQPNELGVVPILEYHALTTDPAEVAQFVRLADDMRADLEWLYSHDFHIVPLRDIFNNTIQVPAGKHPVALTFDDGLSSQFSFLLDANGELVTDDHGDPVPDPDTAVGILEAFSAKHPDFGRGGHFAPTTFQQFADPDVSQLPYFNQKLQWLVDRGYEIGNHTAYHADLLDLPNDAFSREVVDPMISMDAMLGDIPGNQSRILTLPYGNIPDRDKHPDQRRMMREGIPYQGKTYHLAGALLVGADPAWSPASTQWDPFVVPRIQAFDESLDFWFGMFESGGVILYTSDGDPETIAVPQPLPPMLQGHLDVDALMAAGKTVIQYDPESGKTMFAVQVNMRSIAVVPARNNPESGFGRYTAGEYSYPLSTIR